MNKADVYYLIKWQDEDAWDVITSSDIDGENLSTIGCVRNVNFEGSMYQAEILEVGKFIALLIYILNLICIFCLLISSTFGFGV